MDSQLMLTAINVEPNDDTAWLALADCLEEEDRSAEAELTRLREWLLRARPKDPERSDREKRMQKLLIAGTKPIVPRRRVELKPGVSMDMVMIPPGTFWMGSPSSEPGRYSDEGPRHQVRLTRAFWFGLTPLTQRQWEAITGNNPSRFVGPDHPVECVSWFECVQYCRLLSEHTGHQFRLPTEAEWEYACRAGTLSAFHIGPTESELAFCGWYHANTDYGTRPVGHKVPNAWGLMDLHGNVREWCQDIDYDYTMHLRVDPVYHGEGERTLRGGSWYNSPEMCRSAFRFTMDPGSRGYGYGCRLVMEAD